MTGDFALEQLGTDRVAIIKIDVEGAELEVLQGFYNTIKTEQPFVIFECLPKITRTDKKKLDDKTLELRANANRQIAEFFKSLDYHFFYMDDNGVLDRRNNIIAHGTEVENYLAFHAEVDIATIPLTIRNWIKVREPKLHTAIMCVTLQIAVKDQQVEHYCEYR